MQITTKITYVGFLLAVSTLTSSAAQGYSTFSNTNLTIETRLSRITEIIRQKGIDISTNKPNKPNDLIGFGWSDGRRGNWVNLNRGGFANRHGGGSFINRRPWGDRGGFYNRRPWRNGGFINRW